MDKEGLKHKAELLEVEIDEIFFNMNSKDESRLDDLFYDLALVEEELNVMATSTEVLDNNFDDLDESDYNLLRGVANEND